MTVNLAVGADDEIQAGADRRNAHSDSARSNVTENSRRLDAIMPEPPRRFPPPWSIEVRGALRRQA